MPLTDHAGLILLLRRLTFAFIAAGPLIPHHLAGQGSVSLRGKTVDSTGHGIEATVVVRAAAAQSEELAHGTSSPSGEFQLAIPALPSRITIDATTRDGFAGHLSLDDSTVRASSERPIMVHLRAPHALSAVRVRARAQRRPSVFYFFDGEPSTRMEGVSPAAIEWLDPLAIGNVDALLRASPDMLVSAAGAASLLGAGSASNQVQLGGIRVPSGLVSGELGGALAESPWDATIGGAAGATVNLFLGPASKYRTSYATVRSGIGGVPAWADNAPYASGRTVPLQLGVGTTGPLGPVAYRANAFVSREVTHLPHWGRLLDAKQRTVLDSIARVLDAETFQTADRAFQSGAIVRIDFEPFSDKRVTALTSALTRSTTTGGTRGGFITGSAGTTSTNDVGLLQFESTRIVRERVLWTSNVSAALARNAFQRATEAPTVQTTEDGLGGLLVTGGAMPHPSTSLFSGEARTSGTWYSVDNKTRYVFQLQTRLENGHVDPTAPHTTFTAPSLTALSTGSAIALTRESTTRGASASSLVVAPALSARRDLGPRGSVVFGVRADAWMARGLFSGGASEYLDVSPRIALLRRLGARSANRGPIATLRVGAGRFTDWPSVQQWSAAWRGSGSLSTCTGSTVPALDFTTDDATCGSGATTQIMGRTIAAAALRPPASDRVDASIAFASVLPGVRAELGGAVARNQRMLATLPPTATAPVVDHLTGEGGRALLVSAHSISPAGVVPLAELPTGSVSTSTLVSAAASTAAQWRIRLATQDPFAQTKWSLTYTATAGRERTLTVASPLSAPGFVSGPLAAGGRHTVAFSLGEWIGDMEFRFAGIARSGMRFTPVADRDLNGDGRANDAVYVPAALADSWGRAVDPSIRSCIRAASGRILGVNSCVGPWSLSSLFLASIPAARFGLPHGSTLDIQVSNPAALLGRGRGVSFGNSSGVNPILFHVTGYDSVTQQFRGVPLKGVGTSLGLAPGLNDPVRLALSVRIPLGPSITSQRAAAAVRALATDTSARGRQAAAIDFVSDLPPIPLVVLRAGSGIQLTADQRRALQALGARWQANAGQIVLGAYSSRPNEGSLQGAHQRLVAARATFVAEASAIAAETRALLTPDQIDLLPEGVQRLLNPRLWRFASLQDAAPL